MPRLTAAAAGAETTKAMVATKGRSARLGDRSLGHIDPGAASAVTVIEAMPTGAETAERSDQTRRFSAPDRRSRANRMIST